MGKPRAATCGGLGCEKASTPVSARGPRAML